MCTSGSFTGGKAARA